MIKAFLSHTSVDKDLVGLVQERLTKSNAWYDAVDIENGESIPEKINEGLRNATHYVLFWSERASLSAWVQAELNAAFVQMMAGKCRFMIFSLDDTKLPELLQPYKYDKVDKSNLFIAAETIADKILAQDGAEVRLSRFVNRTSEIGDIEEAARAGYKLVILYGMLGIGKASLAEKAMHWLYQNRATQSVVLDFNTIPGMAELVIEFSRYTKVDIPNNNIGLENQKNNIKYFLEIISLRNAILILKNVKSWLDEDGSLSANLQFITDLIISTDMFENITIITSSRYIDIPYNYFESTRQLHIKGMSDLHISEIIKNGLPLSFESNADKNLEFAKRMYGYPLGAKLGAYHIGIHGYDYYLEQPQKIQSLKIGLAKEFVTYAGISTKCQRYLRVLALSKSRLRNEEYALAFPDLQKDIAALADEAFFSGIISFDEDGCYKLEAIVEDYFYDLAFNSPERKEICNALETFLRKEIEQASGEKYMRLITAIIHILALNGKVGEAQVLRADLTETIIFSMWDQYNHTEYDEALATANALLKENEDNLEARYVKALCLTRFDEYGPAESILNQLLEDDTTNNARYYYALGRIQKHKGNYPKAIELFEVAVLKKAKYLSPYREMADCYIHMGELDNAQLSISKAKKIDESNVFVILLEALLLQKQEKADEAIKLLENQSLLEQKAEQIFFRKGRAYDQLGCNDKACECYTQSLQQNPRMYDAKLCLLNHEIIDNPSEASKTINELKKKLKGKRAAILTNIEARFIGYIEHREQDALQLLESVKPTFRDRQWYAVKIQLLEKMIEKHQNAGRNILANECKNNLAQTKQSFEEKYGVSEPVEADLLPDA